MPTGCDVNYYSWILGIEQKVNGLLGDAAQAKIKSESNADLQMLAAVVAGNMVGAAGYCSGRFINEVETAGDALAIAREIIAQSAK